MTDPTAALRTLALRIRNTYNGQAGLTVDAPSQADRLATVDAGKLYAIEKELLSVADALAAVERESRFDFRAHLQRQREFSELTFGPGARTAGVVDHIRKELREIEAEPIDLREWIDVVILALDGAWRAGYDPDEIIDALVTKQARNEARRWPDWRTAAPDKAIEHMRPSPPAGPRSEEG